MSKVKYSFFDFDDIIQALDEKWVFGTENDALAVLRNADVGSLVGLPWTLEKREVMVRVTVTPKKLRIRKSK